MKTTSIKLEALPINSQFYFCDPTLSGGVNRLTCFRRTRCGITNGVTGHRVTFRGHPGLSQRDVVLA